MTTTTTTRFDLEADGDHVRIGDATFTGSSAYPDAIAWLTNQAADASAPVLVHSTENDTDPGTWFTLDQEGSLLPATAPVEPLTAASTPAPVVTMQSMPAPEDAVPTPAASTPPPGAGAGDRIGRSSSPFRGPVRQSDEDATHTGPRAAVYTATAGLVNLGPSQLEQETDELAKRIARKLNGSHSTAFLSLKGGVGKSSTTGGVGMMLAEYRGDPPCAVDMNPDSGDLAERVVGEANYDQATAATVTDVVKEASKIESLTDLSRYMHHANRLHVIAGEQDPDVSDAMTAADYNVIRDLVARYYSVVLTDCGTGVSHPAMTGILGSVSNVVIATGYAVSGAKRAAAVIEWLRTHGYPHLADGAIVVITDKDGVSSQVNRQAILETLTQAAAQLIEVPRDKAVADGDQIDPDRVSPATRLAWMRAAAAIVDGYR